MREVGAERKVCADFQIHWLHHIVHPWRKQCAPRVLAHVFKDVKVMINPDRGSVFPHKRLVLYKELFEYHVIDYSHPDPLKFTLKKSMINTVNQSGYLLKRTRRTSHVYVNGKLRFIDWSAQCLTRDEGLVQACLLAERLTYVHLTRVRKEIYTLIWCWKHARGTSLALLQRDVLLLICQTYIHGRPPDPEWYRETSWEQLDDDEKDYERRSGSEERDNQVMRLVVFVVSGFYCSHTNPANGDQRVWLVFFWVLFVIGTMCKWLPDTKKMYEGPGMSKQGVVFLRTRKEK